MEKNLSFQNNRLVYQVRGQGQPLMLVHGFGEDHRIWEDAVGQLEKRFMLLLPDLPGSGSSPLNTDVSMENMTGALHAILQQEQLEAVTLLGHSMGGYVSLAFVEKYPDMVVALGLVHSSAYADNEEKILTRKKGIEFIKKHGTHEFLKTSTPNLFWEQNRKERPQMVEAVIEQYKDMDANALVAYYEAMIERPDRTEVLKKFARPVLFLAGEHDITVPYEHVLQQSTLPLLSYLHVLHGSAHMGMLEEPNEFGFILEEYIKNNVL